MAFLNRFVTAILSAFIFSFILALMLIDVGGFWISFTIVMAYSLGIFLIAGISFSYVGDYVIRKIGVSHMWLSYLTGVIVYVIGGIIGNIFFFIGLYHEGFAGYTIPMMINGILGALLFYHLRYVVRFSFQRFVIKE
ncbi:hypothetical protein J2R98_000032 [Alkalibacillus filiformis]|uniref:GtrA-like protein domain-containing protein n=1 Tax=Alkalibacillus filiformis TaxID=200990 RepID=A0ABU0DPG9_9BACI|nr:hypothetical protein [Alkalibacillus filiformis]MDQ0350229.1 hypothetical protein [Alkalibacillus filiformis]